MEQQKLMDAAKSSSSYSSSSALSSSSSADNTFSPIPMGSKAILLMHNILLKKDNLLKWAKSNHDLFTSQRRDWKLGFQSVINPSFRQIFHALHASNLSWEGYLEILETAAKDSTAKTEICT